MCVCTYICKCTKDLQQSESEQDVCCGGVKVFHTVCAIVYVRTHRHSRYFVSSISAVAPHKDDLEMSAFPCAMVHTSPQRPISRSVIANTDMLTCVCWEPFFFLHVSFWILVTTNMEF